MGSWREGVRDGAVWVRGWLELPGAAGVMCLPHAPPPLPEQDLARTSEGTEAFSLQVQNSNLILQVQNLDLRSKIFFALLVWVDSCPPQRVSPSTSYLQNATSLQGRHSCGAAALQRVCGSTGEARGTGTASSEPLRDLSKHNSKRWADITARFHYIPSSVCRGTREYSSIYEEVLTPST